MPLSSISPEPISSDRRTFCVEGLSFQYERNHRQEETWALKDVSFTVGLGEILGIVGPNGSGKSTLLKILAGQLRPSTGTVHLGDRLIGNRSPKDIARRIAVVPQEYAQVFPFSVAETVLMGRFPHRTSGWWDLGIGDETTHDLACVKQAMAETDILSLAPRLVSDLSGGERQRVMIARALAQEPTILLLDEPTAFLDINHQIEIGGLIGRLRKDRQLTVVLVSHDLNLASQSCDRVLMLKEGRLCQDGSPEETIRQDILRTVYGCEVVVDTHPSSGKPRVSLPIEP